MAFRHSKIVCTIGPASSSPRIIERLIQAGMDVARLNFSHGKHEDHARSIDALRAAAVEHEKPIAILADLQGPKIRTGPLAGGVPVTLRAGQRFVITTARVPGDSNCVSTTRGSAHRCVEERVGMTALLVESSQILAVLEYCRARDCYGIRTADDSSDAAGRYWWAC